MSGEKTSTSDGDDARSDENPEVVRVDFTPPALGKSRVFLPIAGEGEVQFLSDRVILRGYHLRSYRGCVFAGVFIGAIFAAGCGVGVVAPALGLEASGDIEIGLRSGVGLALAGLFFYVARLATPDAADTSKEVEFAIRPTDVESIESGRRRAAGTGSANKVRINLSGTPDPEYDDEYVLHINPADGETELPDRLRTWLERAD